MTSNTSKETLADPNPESEEISNSAEGEAIAEGVMEYRDIIIPPSVFIVMIVIALFLLSVTTQNLWWNKICCSKRHRIKANRLKNENQKLNGFSHSNESLLSEADKEIIHIFKCFQNSPKGLVRIALPVIISIGFCPVTIYLYPELMKFFWGPNAMTTRPNINDAIASFLVPAGIVYAVAFGFTFQDILLKQQDLETELKKQINAMIQMRNIVEYYHRLDITCRKRTLKILKEYTLNVMHGMVNNNVKTNAAASKLWEMLDILQVNEEILQFKLSETDRNIHESLYEHTLLLDSYLSSRIVGRNINILQWLFLECLGFVSFFGVLLLSADSYRLELTLCILTVVTVSAFSYILADFDCPYHGAFKLNFSVYVTYLEGLERLYQCLIDLQNSKQKKNSDNLCINVT